MTKEVSNRSYRESLSGAVAVMLAVFHEVPLVRENRAWTWQPLLAVGYPDSIKQRFAQAKQLLR